MDTLIHAAGNASTNPNFHPDNCTLSTCPISMGYVTYDPSLAGNVLYLAIFAALIPVQIGLGWWYRTSGVMISILVTSYVLSTLFTKEKFNI